VRVGDRAGVPGLVKRLHYGDNLEVLRRDIPDASVDLVYLDPPFNSAANYNVLFRAPDGKSSESQLEAFEDTWHWGDASEQALHDVLVNAEHPDAATLLRGIVSALGRNDMTAYLSMMAVRLIELHRVLKPTGSLYLHCEPTASHYLKIVLDGIFGIEQFVNEISWKRTSAKSDHVQGATHFPRVRDVLLRYIKKGGGGGNQSSINLLGSTTTAKSIPSIPFRMRMDDALACGTCQGQAVPPKEIQFTKYLV